MRRHKSRILLLFSIIFTLLPVFFSCEEAVRITSSCELIAYLKFYNQSADILEISFADSTDWIPLGVDIDSKKFSHDKTIDTVFGNSEIYDTMTISWVYEHDDIYSSDGAVCSATVDLNLQVYVLKADSIIKTIDLGLYCSQLIRDTTYTDTTKDLYINTFSTSKVFVIP